MSELGFSPSPAARRLSLGRTLTVGVLVSFLTRPQAAERLRGVDAVLADSEFDLVIYNVESVQKRDHYLSTLLVSQRVDGLLVMSLPPSEEVAAALATAPVPVVFIDVHARTIGGLPRVLGDDAAGGSLAAQHLIELGHTRFGFIGDAPGGPFMFTSSNDREAGYSSGLRNAGIELPDKWIGHGGHGRYEALDLARRMLASPDRPTAILAASDTQALGVLAAARDAGLTVPRDLSVVGYDDIEIADYVGLTTVRQHLFGSGRVGAELLLEEIRGLSHPAPEIHLAPELVSRGTTGHASG
jgi:DNA-binding LacI/PurR family transcriptional regulator